MDKVLFWMDWLFRDLHTRRGKYVIAEVPNWPLLTFMVLIVLAVIQNPGAFQKSLFNIAYLALIWWGIKEYRSGRSRFRKLLGILGIAAAIGAFFLTLTW